MDEKTDGVPSDQLPASDASVSAGNGADTEILPPSNLTGGTESFISVASTDTATSTDTFTDANTENTTITVSNESTSTKETTTATVETSSSEASVTNVVTSTAVLASSDALHVADTLTSVNDSQSVEQVTSPNVKPEDTKIIANKASPVDVTKPSPAVCQLEEELKRLHEGDPVEESKSMKSVTVEASENSVQKDNSTTTESTDTSQAGTLLAVEESSAKELDPVEMLTAADDVSKDPILIRSAQEDLKKIDVLVCGSCHEVFHFLEEFQMHKSGKCTGKSNLTSVCEGESKPQVWGFTLWKNKQQKKFETLPSSWVIYQKWCKLPQIDKDAWIIAGQTIQFCTKVGTAKVTEIKPKPQQKQVERDPLALDGFADSNKENSIVVNTSTENKPNASEVIKKSIVKPVKLNNDVTILPSTKNGEPNSNKALRTVRSTEKREYVVERIVAKRFNPKRKTWEYQIKWENFPSEDNTWEPISNLNHCKQMVEEFEEQLKKLKAEKAKQQAGISPKGRGRPIKMAHDVASPGSSSFGGDVTPGRPQRTSKQKALNQVKAWCGNISDTDEGGVKRSFEDDDSDDSFEKKMKYEEYSDDSDLDIKPKTTTFKKIAPKPTPVQIIKNGVGKVTPLPQNVLIPDANGVVRINQKQLPSLSTGVYIMSKTAGIIKLDSTTSKVATSGGQTIVKVAPKIGQTQIKIVKKDGGTTTTKQIIQMTPKSATTTPTKIYKPVITKVKKQAEAAPKPTPPKIIVKSKEEPKKEPKKEIKKPDPTPMDDESDDGLEELPFPDDLPLPEPDSPPRDFVLDPITGKIAGQEYPEPELKVEEVKPEADDTSLENIVQLAAADITEDDLKNESGVTPMETEPIPSPQAEEPRIIRKTEPATSITSSPVATTTPVKVTMTPTLVKSEPSILNKALSGSAILRKSLMNTSPQPKVQQRILNQSVAARSHNMSPVVRSVTHGSSLVRTRPVAPRPKFNIAGSSSIIRSSHHEVAPKNVYSKSTMPTTTRKIGNTTIRSAGTGVPAQKMAARIVQTTTSVQKVSPRKDSLLIRTQATEKSTVPAKPKTVISMPSLIGDDESSSSPPPSEVTKSPILPSPTKEPTLDTPAVTPATTTESSVETPLTTTDASSPITDISSFTLADSENPIFITGDDGTVYQVAGQNEHGQTILLTQGSDGQQQCLLVTNEIAEAMETSAEEPQAELSMPEIAADVTEPLSVKTDADASDQVVAQVVRAEPPSPGGTHKVVVMLPDGNLMVTQVSPEEYASLELE